MGNIGNCKCNKQQDHNELDLNKDKKEILENNSKRQDEETNNVDNQDKNVEHNEENIVNNEKKENLNEIFAKKSIDIFNCDSYRNNNKDKDNEQTGDHQNNNYDSNQSANKINEYNNNFNQNENHDYDSNFLVNNAQLENAGNSINTNNNNKNPAHLKSNSNEIKMEIYEDEQCQNLNNNEFIKNLQNQVNQKKKYNNNNTNPSVASNTNSKQLEIINEINADASKESFYDAKIVNKVRYENHEMKLENDRFINTQNGEDNAKVMISENNINDKNGKNIHNNKILDNGFPQELVNNNKFAKNFPIKNNRDIKNEFNMNFSKVYDDLKTNTNENYDSVEKNKNYNPEDILKINNYNTNDQQYEEIQPQKLNDVYKNYSTAQPGRNQGNLQSRFNKSSIPKEDRWKKLKINNIISERILLSNQDDVICFQSDLKKLNPESNVVTKENLIYTLRFCVLNKIGFKIFKSREQFLRLQKPQIEIPINNIKECNYLNFNNKKMSKNSHFYINYSNINGDSKLEDRVESNNYKCSYIDDSSAIIDKLNGKSKKIGYLESNTNNLSKDHTAKKSVDMSDMNHNPIVVFGNEDEDLINKWIAVLNYFINK